ncbi:class E sortase [Leucobacter sp. UCMA 4100]|uniref:class E sortase n=1 Tax=Leucobacter sp. UCMA 4100 TaxID=2810534 RepID=UPI0022EAB6B6|nr:class E sortase [Leucobacter sp. UCMA 4100]MDA3147070.1 class E sortase [Leucobacter sp. UCMA 4100]
MARNDTPRRKRKRLRVSTVIGETFIVLGLAMLGYIVWQPWYTTVVVQGEQRELASGLVSQWEKPEAEPEPGVVPIVAKPTEGDYFAVVYIPAFATDFKNTLSEGTDAHQVLNLDEKGIGRYSKSSELGELGNTAFAAHRSGAYTAPFREVDALRVGDPIFIQTPEGWYTYRYRSSEYVWPNETDVLAPFPRIEGRVAEQRILTMTSCHPKNLGISERVITYSVFESFSPTSEGIPKELLALNPALAETGEAAQ